MATITANELLGAYGDYSSADVADLTWTNLSGDDDVFTLHPDDILLIWNPDDSAHSLDITSQPDPKYGRSADISSYSVGAGEIAAFGPFQPHGWADSSGQLTINGTTDLDAAVLRLR